MSYLPRQNFAKIVAVIGGGFTGSLLALKLAGLRPAWTILLIEKRARLGRGLAYGDCGPQHVLNVPVSRMEVGLEPGFAEWLRTRPAALTDALAESGGSLADAFVPRRLFGDYLEQQVQSALTGDPAGGIKRIHGEAMAVSALPRQVLLDDGRVFAADVIVLATGNEAPAVPFASGAAPRLVADPWAPGALDGIAAEDAVVLVGTGLTMIDVVLSLRARGHRGSLRAISRHGLLPRPHRAGGAWPPVLAAGMSPRQALRAVRRQVREAGAQGVPWQRVFDAVRPAVAATWHDWTLAQRAQFQRHLRAIWDVHRHRMAGRLGRQVGELLADGVLQVAAGRIVSVREVEERLRVAVRPRRGAPYEIVAAAVINCTGPLTDIRRTAQPLLANLHRNGLVRSDPLGLGLESDDCAVLDAQGAPPGWLFALGPLTRPAWWEIVAVPEIRAQVERLARRIANESLPSDPRLSALFLDMGAGI